MARSHAYSILAAFEMTHNSATQKLLLIRNPWGTTAYNGPYNKGDSAWDDAALLAKVPLNVNPKPQMLKESLFCQ